MEKSEKLIDLVFSAQNLRHACFAVMQDKSEDVTVQQFASALGSACGNFIASMSLFEYDVENGLYLPKKNDSCLN